ncbi:MAG: Nif3-like dinuclear metal center hexameric protein [Promethearchaeota archaeon]
MLLNMLLSYLTEEIPGKKGYLQFGSIRNQKNKVIKKVIVTVDPTLESIDYARKNKGNFIICYNPLLNKELNQIDESLRGKILLLSQNNIMVYVLDSPEPIIETVTNILNLEIINFLGLTDKYKEDESLGRICRRKNTHRTFNEFINDIKRNIKMNFIRFYQGNSLPLKKIGLYIGDNLSLEKIRIAYKSGCTCIITDKISYSQAVMIRNYKISFIELSNYAIANLWFKNLTLYIGAEFPRIEVEFFDSKEIISIL